MGGVRALEKLGRTKHETHELLAGSNIGGLALMAVGISQGGEHLQASHLKLQGMLWDLFYCLLKVPKAVGCGIST